MASINFYTNGLATNVGGSALGFYGSSFGTSVTVGAYQTSTYITDSNGTIQGPQGDNNMWTHPGSGSINGGGSLVLTAIPNYQATLNIRFTHSTAVTLQNSKLRIFDRSNINNPASGVTTKVAEIVHPTLTQTNNGSGSSTWSTPGGSGTVLTFSFTSPGMSGNAPNGNSTSADRHDFFVAISASPDSVGSKTQYAAYFETEYL
jgi:hypothetical protein